jgi:hypothetical protein
MSSSETSQRFAVTSNACGSTKWMPNVLHKIYGRRIMVIVYFSLRAWATQAWKDILSELDLLARSPPLAGSLSGNCLLSVLFHHGIVGEQPRGTIERRPNRYGNRA